MNQWNEPSWVGGVKNSHFFKRQILVILLLGYVAVRVVRDFQTFFYRFTETVEVITRCRLVSEGNGMKFGQGLNYASHPIASRPFG